MKEIAPETELELLAGDETTLAEIIPIRTEATLSRLPLHRISKKGEVKIKQTKLNERGKLVTTWEVRHPPGPLSYKVDTLIVNRRIDEMRNKGEIRELFKLGGLRDICVELGISPNGKATNAVKEALRENAFAGITARLDYTANDGQKRYFEIAATRYTVYFVGQELPNGKTADSVYVRLHEDYHKLLLGSKTRPLDYGYLKELQPSSQRLYELLSFSMFGALTHDRPNAQMNYSAFCESAPLTRYFESKKMHTQMWKVCRPHVASGYLKSVDFEETVDADGQSDWLMRFVPGRRARREFREFTTKKVGAAPSTPRLAKGDDTKAIVSILEVEDSDLVARLVAAGVTESIARTLASKDREECERQLDALLYRDRIKDRGGYLTKAIRDKYAMPTKMEQVQQKQPAEKQQTAKDVLREQYYGAYSAYLNEELEALQTRHPKARKVFDDDFAQFASLPFEQAEADRDAMRIGCFERFITENSGLEILTFEQWLERGK